MSGRSGEGPVGGSTRVTRIGDPRAPHFKPGTKCARCGEQMWRSQAPRRKTVSGRARWVHLDCENRGTPHQHEVESWERAEANRTRERAEAEARAARDPFNQAHHALEQAVGEGGDQVPGEPARR